MGMTIDKAILKLQFVRNALNDDMEIAKACDLAIDVMLKYQKIEQIVKSKTTRLSYDFGFEQIKKVVEDGNDD